MLMDTSMCVPNKDDEASYLILEHPEWVLVYALYADTALGGGPVLVHGRKQATDIQERDHFNDIRTFQTSVASVLLPPGEE